MTIKEINEKFKELEEKISNIESILNDASKGIDFYNACKSYYATENGSIEQREAILDIFSIGFDFAEGKVPNWLGGCIIDQGGYLMDLVGELGENTFIKEIECDAAWDLAMNPNGEWSQVSEEYNKKMAYAKQYHEIREAIKEVQEINQLDQVFYDIGLINPLTGEIDLTLYNNWEDVVKQYAEEHNLFEDGFDEFSAHISNIIGEAGDWFKELYDDLKYGKEITPHEPTRKITKDTVKKLHTARTTRYDPLILDLDGDGFNVEKKELGANFDLDKNGFAEKINWTSRYNLKRKRVFDIIS